MADSKRDLQWFNGLPNSEGVAQLLQCCGSRKWGMRMVENRPFTSLEDLSAKASEIWWSLDREDWLEAFRAHPRIGSKKATSAISEQSRTWSLQEQAAIQNSSPETLRELATLNQEYQINFGYIFIVCATGKSSDEMLAILKSRLRNDEEVELRIAAAEQEKITELRLRRLLN